MPFPSKESAVAQSSTVLEALTAKGDMLDAEAGNLRLLLSLGYAIPLGIDIDTHTIVNDES